MERRVVTRIEPTRRAHGLTPINIPELRKVAGYARVSTDNEEQEDSYEAQVRYFTNYIHNHEGWTFAGMYTDMKTPSLIQFNDLRRLAGRGVS